VFFNRKRVIVKPLVHAGLQIIDGFLTEDIDSVGQYVVKHYWIDGWAQLIEKHRRYIVQEGPTRLARGESFGWLKLSVEVISALRTSLFRRSGWRGGWRGISLSFFYAWYVAMSVLSLRDAESSRRFEH
jgi:hypothetical protein